MAAKAKLGWDLHLATTNSQKSCGYDGSVAKITRHSHHMHSSASNCTALLSLPEVLQHTASADKNLDLHSSLQLILHSFRCYLKNQDDNSSVDMVHACIWTGAESQHAVSACGWLLLPIPHHDTAIGNNGRKNTASTVFNLIKTISGHDGSVGRSASITPCDEKASGKNGHKSTERGLDLQLLFVLWFSRCCAGRPADFGTT